MKRLGSDNFLSFIWALISSISVAFAEKNDKFDSYVKDNFYEIALTYGVDPLKLSVHEGIYYSYMAY